MEQRLKNRLVGASVIVAAVVIFVPEYFEDPATVEEGSTAEQSPEAEFSSRIVPIDQEAVVEVEAQSTPAVEEAIEVAEDEPQPSGLSEPEAVSGATTEPEALTADTESPRSEGKPIPRVKPSLAPDEGGERVGLTVWAVQLGSFSIGQNALALRDRLREQGYAAFVQTVVAETGSITRVYVGPELFKEQAESVRKRLVSETSLEAMVVRYPRGIV